MATLFWRDGLHLFHHEKYSYSGNDSLLNNPRILSIVVAALALSEVAMDVFVMFLFSVLLVGGLDLVSSAVCSKLKN